MSEEESSYPEEKENSVLKKSAAEYLICALAAHPYLAAGGICLFIHPFYFGSKDYLTVSAVFFFSFLFLSAAGFVLAGKCRHQVLRKWQAGVIWMLFFVLSLLTARLLTYTRFQGTILLLSGGVFLCLMYMLLRTKRYLMQKRALFLMGFAFLLRIYYVFETWIYDRQHDVSSFDSKIGDGHTGYILYLFKHHHLPDFDPRGVFQFYHPPFHHTVSALWIGLNTKIFGVDFDAAAESLQTLSLFYSMVILITVYKILRLLKLEGKALYAALFLTAFHPTWIYFSGSINNDTLSVAFMAGAVYLTLKWFREQTFKNIIKIALCVGFGMMTKLSAALVAPPIAVLFLYVFIKHLREKGGILFLQYLVFGVFCVPLGLWWEVRNYIRFRVPVTYIQELLEIEPQYLGKESVTSRLFDFSPSQFSSVYEQWLVYLTNGTTKGHNEKNPLIALLKNALFGEYVREDTFAGMRWVDTWNVFFFWFCVVLAFLAFVFMIYVCVRKKRMEFADKLFFVAFYVTMLVGYYRAAFQYPFVCTMDFRYIPLTVAVGALFYGMFMMPEKGVSGEYPVVKWTRRILFLMTVLFAVFSSVFIIMLCMQ